jgi:hypothetical protein
LNESCQPGKDNEDVAGALCHLSKKIQQAGRKATQNAQTRAGKEEKEARFFYFSRSMIN